MTRIITTLILLLAGAAQAQDTARVRFAWAQPDTTVAGTPMLDGRLQEYQVFLAAMGDTNMVATTPAPFALADSAWAYVTVPIGEPITVRVRVKDKWDQIGPFSEWSDVHIVIPDPPGKPSKPAVVNE